MRALSVRPTTGAEGFSSSTRRGRGAGGRCPRCRVMAALQAGPAEATRTSASFWRFAAARGPRGAAQVVAAGCGGGSVSATRK